MRYTEIEPEAPAARTTAQTQTSVARASATSGTRKETKGKAKVSFIRVDRVRLRQPNQRKSLTKRQEATEQYRDNHQNGPAGSYGPVVARSAPRAEPTAGRG